jgi:hypothetical protein
MREPNVHIPAKSNFTSLSKCLQVFVYRILKRYVRVATFTSQYANTGFPNYEVASMLLQASRPTFVQLVRPQPHCHT